MTKVVMRRAGRALVPAEDEAAEMIAKMPEGKDVVVEVRQARNPKQHRLYWALMGLLADNVEWIPHKDAASTLVKIATHEVDMIIDGRTGEITYVPRSINWESMDGARFGRFLDRVLYVICSRWLVGNDVEELRQRVYEMIDGPAAASLGRREAA
jgi:hypothetical protein